MSKIPRRPNAPLFQSGTAANASVEQKLLNTRVLNDTVQRIAHGLGIPTGRAGEGFVIHSSRHFFETRALNSGIPQRMVDAWLGHSSDRAMGRVYYAVLDADSQGKTKELKFS